MRSGRVGLILLVTLAAVAACTSRSSDPETAAFVELSGEQIRKTLIGNTLHREGDDLLESWEIAQYFPAAGTMKARLWWPGGEELASGTWEVSEKELYCRKWYSDWGEGKPGCFKVSRAGDRVAFDHVSGSRARGNAKRRVFRLLADNPYGL